MSEDWDVTRVKADIDRFKAMVVDADVEYVDEPTGVKEVEIAWEDDDGFHTESGRAIGVYREWTQDTTYHVDWVDDRGRTTVTSSQLVDLDESDYKTS